MIKPTIVLPITALVLLVGCDIGRPLRVIDEPRAVRRLELSTTAVEAAVGDTVRMEARAYTTGDRVVNEAVVTWAAGNPVVLELVRPGVFVARRAGVSEVLAASGSQTARATVTVR